jgi:hypothetical protein
MAYGLWLMAHGSFGTEDDWQTAEAAWTALTHGEVFHAADWEYAGRKDEYKALAQTLAVCTVAGVVYAIDLVAFNQLNPDTLRESAYLKCFARMWDNKVRFLKHFDAKR